MGLCIVFNVSYFEMGVFHLSPDLNKPSLPQKGLQCESGLEYQECGTICESSCFVGKQDERCQTDCYEGCHCPNGTVMHEGKCIVRDECPCMIDGIVFNNGETIKINCMEW